MVEDSHKNDQCVSSANDELKKDKIPDETVSKTVHACLKHCI